MPPRIRDDGSLPDGERARMVFTDPPYNVPIDGHVGGSGKVKHWEFAMAAGEMSVSQFTGFLRTAFRNLAGESLDGAIHFICMDWRHMGEVQAAAEGVYSELKNLLVWVKDNGGMGSFYRTIKVRDGEKSVTVPIAQAVVRSLAVNAAKGQHRAQRLFAELLSATETANKRLHDEWLQNAIEYKTEWERELERRKRHGIEAPDPIPHPDDIEIDVGTGEVIVKGPFTREEKERLDFLRERKAVFERDAAELRQELADNPDHEHRKFLEDEISHYEKVLGMIRQVIPD